MAAFRARQKDHVYRGCGRGVSSHLGCDHLLPKSEGIDILAFGLLAATMVVVPIFLIGLLIYRIEDQKIRPPLRLMDEEFGGAHSTVISRALHA